MSNQGLLPNQLEHLVIVSTRLGGCVSSSFIGSETLSHGLLYAFVSSKMKKQQGSSGKDCHATWNTPK